MSRQVDISNQSAGTSSAAVGPRSADAAAATLTKSVWLANIRQELVTPVTAVRHLTKMLLRDVEDRGATQLLADLQRVHESTEELHALVEALLDPPWTELTDKNMGNHIRHELRNPLTAIIGYTELWLEQAADQLLEGFVPDLEQILALARKMLSGVNQLVDFSRVASDEQVHLDVALVSDMIAYPGRPSSLAEGQVIGPTWSAAILVVDDNPINADLLSRLLLRRGHRVTTAVNGKEALERLRAEPFDLLVLDIIMPVMNGFQVLEQLKADANLRHLPVLVISALGELDSVAHCILLGAEDCLPKPFNEVLLKARVDACLNKKRLLEKIRREQQRADELLCVILPDAIAREMKETNEVVPRRYENVAVLFCDVVGFTPYCVGHAPEQVVLHLKRLIERWEEIALCHQVEKIKTIGDALMAAAGLLQQPAEDPVLHCVRCGLEMIQATQELGNGWNLRVGIHYGPVVAGVIGKRQYLFDLWGDTVNTAARMESHGIPGSITLSNTAWQQIADCCHGESRGLVPVKGKEPMEMVRFVGFQLR